MHESETERWVLYLQASGHLFTKDKPLYALMIFTKNHLYYRQSIFLFIDISLTQKCNTLPFAEQQAYQERQLSATGNPQTSASSPLSGEYIPPPPTPPFSNQPPPLELHPFPAIPNLITTSKTLHQQFNYLVHQEFILGYHLNQRTEKEKQQCPNPSRQKK